MSDRAVRIKGIADYYKDAPAYEVKPIERMAFKAYVDKQFKDLPLLILFVVGQPYKGLKDLTADITRGILRVSIDNNNPPESLMDKETNLHFRAIHDWHHYLADAPFSYEGEHLAWKLACKFTQMHRLHDILYSEIVMQACYTMTYDEFPQQKVVL